ncbi:MAG TPA: thiamine phosphate synthase [Firmicutes bacterium]|nr:thiamine phosphate synthase [Bacillota bacterium]
MQLYLVTDRSWLGGKTLLSQVEACLDAGVTFLQLREKDLDERSFLEEAREIGRAAKSRHIPFVVNDNLQVALQSDADGVHVGQHDMAAKDVRALIGPDKILGVSAQTVEQAVAAERAGADYLGVGAVFHTSTKLDAADVDHSTLRAICDAVSIPVVAIGGIGPGNILQLAGSGIDGVAVISSILAQPDVAQAAADMKRLCLEMLAK